MSIAVRLLTSLIVLFGCCVLGACGGPTPHENFNAAYDAQTKGDYVTALRLYRPLAQQGNDSAQFNLGRMYANGQGVTQDYAEAVSWYRKAAEQGNAFAQFDLGLLYEKGRGGRRTTLRRCCGIERPLIMAMPSLSSTLASRTRAAGV